MPNPLHHCIGLLPTGASSLPPITIYPCIHSTNFYPPNPHTFAPTLTLTPTPPPHTHAHLWDTIGHDIVQTKYVVV